MLIDETTPGHTSQPIEKHPVFQGTMCHPHSTNFLPTKSGTSYQSQYKKSYIRRTKHISNEIVQHQKSQTYFQWYISTSEEPNTVAPDEPMIIAKKVEWQTRVFRKITINTSRPKSYITSTNTKQLHVGRNNTWLRIVLTSKWIWPNMPSRTQDTDIFCPSNSGKPLYPHNPLDNSLRNIKNIIPMASQDIRTRILKHNLLEFPSITWS